MDEKDASALERIAQFIDERRTEFVGSASLYQDLLTNFYLTCKKPLMRDYRNFLADICYYDLGDQRVLKQGFFYTYGLDLRLKSPGLN